MSKTERIEPWRDFEATVRGFARHIWGVEGGPANIGGVDIDHVIRVNEELYILIEITVERDVNKAREDVIKLRTAKDFLFNQEHIFSRCFCVVDAATVTRAMIEAGAPYRINVVSSKQFKFLFFEYEKYETARSRLQFGSAIDPATGARDDSHYVRVTYTRIGYEKPLSIAEIADLLIGGRRIVLTGEYGSGKSRCVQELFKEFAARQENANRYPIAIDLRRNWGLDRHQEIIRRHFDDLGLSNLADGMLRALPSEAFIFLLDGFDEIGSQAWSTDSEKLRAIRAQSLLGVKDLVLAHNGAIFVTGREHYFNNNEEMLAALGLDEGEVILLRSQEEFSTYELAEFLKRVSIPVAIPDWLPRRPLICKTIADLEPSDLERMFEQEGGDVEFWYHFIDVLCRRDAKTHISFDAQSIFRLLKALARRTRVLAADVGPLSLSDIQQSFQEVVGQAPIEQASIMLQRLPGLGRVRAESDD